MSTALDMRPVAPYMGANGRMVRGAQRDAGGYAWTNWQSVFQPRLGAQLQPDGVSPGTSGADIIASRQSARDQVIQANPLWRQSGQTAKTGPAPIFSNVAEAGSSGEDAQAMFGGVSDGMSQPIATGPAPAANRDFQPPGAAPVKSSVSNGWQTTGSNEVADIAKTYAGGNALYAGGGSQLRF